MKFDTAEKVNEIVLNMKEAAKRSGDNRAILNRLFNGDPPYTAEEATENQIEINRNFLHGVQVLSEARRQWNQAFMSTPRYFNVVIDKGPPQERDRWGKVISKELNRSLKKSRAMMEQIRATGANVILHGIGPVTWRDRDYPFPEVLPIDGLLIPGGTDIDFENLTRFAIRREYTPAQLHDLISGPKVDPGWNLSLAKKRIAKAVSDKTKETFSDPESFPERFAEEIKQNRGFWGSDAVPTIDAWDFYFCEEGDGEGWYRRIVMDSDTEHKEEFLYNSKDRPYVKNLSEILHCQFGDCSAVAPFKYHSVRSLGWLLWGVCDLANRLEGRFYESVFEQLMWFFRAASEEEFRRLRKASFHHMGIIPNGIAFVGKQDRFTPDPNFIESARGTLRSRIAETSAAYTSDFNKGGDGRELTATETMARVNSINALLAGMLTLAYTYEEFKYVEIARRFSTRDHEKAKDFRKACEEQGVPKEILKDFECWEVQAERVIGAGNKTVEMAAVNFLQTIRKNLPPQSQRHVDHLSIRSMTDQPDLADLLAPLDEAESTSNSSHDAELASQRIMAGMQLTFRPNMIAEDYVKVWIKDLAMAVGRALTSADMDMEKIAGMQNMAAHIGQFLQIMGSSDEAREVVKQYGQALSQIMNHVKALEQRAMEQQQAQQPQGDPGAMAKAQAEQMKSQQKLQQMQASHTQKTAQRQVQYELEEQRKDKALDAEIEREGARTQVELATKLATQSATKRPEQNEPI